MRQSSTDRMVAIGQMFEEQGNLERAEAMYRGALKKNGGNQEVRQLLADVQTRRRTPQTHHAVAAATPARKMGAPATAAIAASSTPAVPPEVSGQKVSKTVSVSAGNVGAPSPVQPVVKPVSRLKSAAEVSQPVVSVEKNTTPAPAESSTVAKTAPAPAPAPAPIGAPAAPLSEKQPTVLVSPEQPTAKVITLDDVLSAAESPLENLHLLVEALQSGDGPEVRCLAAALLGECRGDDPQVTHALQEAGRTTSDVGLLLAIVDSQLQLSSMDSQTAANLLRLLPGSDPAVQVQGVTTLRHFAGLDCREQCVTLLTGMLESSHAEVRAAAALTLSDFRPLTAGAVSRLEQLSADDASEEVRESASASLARGLK
ncbi:MAG: HEAT repeat domain-containing protein [Planctomycetaceae bacterium]